MDRFVTRVTAIALVVVIAAALLVSASYAQAPRIKLRLGFPSVADLEDVPALLTAERLRVQGIDLEVTNFAQEVLALQSVLRGDIDIGTGASNAGMNSILAGASLKFFMTQSRNPWTLYSRRDITRCEDISGKRFAIHSEAGVSTALVRGWLREKCPNATPTFLIVPGSENRAAALLAGQVDITPLELSDAIQIDRLRPGQFFRMADFSRDVPWLLASIFYSSPRTISGKRDQIRVFTRELLKVHRLVARDPSVIANVAAKYIKSFDAAMLPEIAARLAAAGYWPTDGGFSLPAVSRTMQFYVDIQAVKPGLKAEEIGDYTIVQSVLEEIGK
jgi:NitT/TauT family transport system substrate-binding protein